MLDARFHGWMQQKSDLMRDGLAAGRTAGSRLAGARGILIVGMGGSGIAGRLVRDALQDHVAIPLLVQHEADLPACVDHEWAVLALSYSGETEETLAAARTAFARGAYVLAFTTGGTLARLATATVHQPTGFQPRAALGYMWMSILGALEAARILRVRVPLADAMAAVDAVEGSCGPDAPAPNEARTIAAAVQQRVPCIYSTPGLGGAAQFLAIVLNENAKRIAFHQRLPEANHNDLMGWSGDALRTGMVAIAVRHKAESDEMERRLAFMQERYGQWGVPWHEIRIAPASGPAERIAQQAGCIHLAEYVSLYVAEQSRVDPSEIAAVQGLKRVLRAEVANTPML